MEGKGGERDYSSEEFTLFFFSPFLTIHADSMTEATNLWTIAFLFPEAENSVSAACIPLEKWLHSEGIQDRAAVEWRWNQHFAAAL